MKLLFMMVMAMLVVLNIGGWATLSTPKNTPTKKHGKEQHYTGVNKHVIYEMNWVNGIKHGEEKSTKYRAYHGTPKLKKTVMWQNGNQVR